MGLLGSHRKLFKWLGVLLIGVPGFAQVWAGLLIKEPLIPYLIKRAGGLDMSNNIWLIALPFGLMALGVLLLFLIWKADKNSKLKKGMTRYSGWVYIDKKRAGAGLKVTAKVGDYESTVITNAAGYYNELEISPPDKSYIGLPTEFYVDGEGASLKDKLSRPLSYMGGGHSGVIDLNVISLQVSDKEEKQAKPAIGGLIGHAGRGAKVRNSHYKGKITIKGTPEEVNVGGLIGQAEENTEVVDSSADAEIEYKQVPDTKDS